MQKTMILLIATMLTSTALAQERIDDYSGKQADLMAAIAGKQCQSDGDALRFGKLENGIGTFGHAGKADARYALGYATLQVERDGSLHTHVISVQKSNKLLHYGGKPYVCK